MSEMTSRIRKLLLGEGASLIGFADLGKIPAELRRQMRYAVSIAVALDPSIAATIGAGPTQDYCHELKRINDKLLYLGEITAEMIKSHGFEAVSSKPTEDVDRIEMLGTDLPHKTAATRSGLGWIGKSSLLVTREYGAAVRLNTVLTSAPVKAGTPMDISQCNGCAECAESCPGGAILGNNWNLDMKRDDFFDAFACCKTAEELSKRMIGANSTICGICIAVCPWTREYIERENGRKPRYSQVKRR